MQDEIQRAVAEELGIEGLSSAEQQELIAQMTGIMLKAATLALLEKLREDKRDEFVIIAESKDEEALRTFLEKELPGSEEIVRAAVSEEIRRFKEYQSGIPAA
ncbi:MAG: DUF5663 domain-containing protein [bacterium]